jgi:type II secretory pathway component PulM
MMDSLSPNLRRALALAFLFVALFGFYGLAIEPFLADFERDSQSIEQLRMVLTRYQSAGRELPDITSRLEELRRRSDSA